MKRFAKDFFSACLTTVITTVLTIFASQFVLSQFFNNIVYAYTHVEVDGQCQSRLAGTMSAESCAAACTMPGYNCAFVKRFKAGDGGLNEDVSCFTCRKQQCSDSGRLDAAGKAACEADPNKQAVAAAPLADGRQCWQCIDKQDKCSTKFPGSSEGAACQAGCKAKDEFCAQVGAVGGAGCFQCIKKVNPPPVQQCANLGLITNAQCATTCQADEDCVAAGQTNTGQVCFQCVKKPKNCDKEGKTNRAICNKCAGDEKCSPDGVAANGEQCYKCEKKNCKESGKKDNSICPGCAAKDGKCVPDGAAPNGEACVKCEKKNCKDIGLNTQDVCAECRKNGEACKFAKKSPSGESCYECSKTSKEECSEGSIPGNCKGDFCSEGELCQDVKPNCHVCKPKPKECNPGDAQGRCAVDSCYPTEICVNTPNDCHRCQKRYSSCEPGALPAACQADSCSAGEYCVNTPLGCHNCLPLPEEAECSNGYAPGPCPGACSASQDCRQTPGPCHLCQQKAETCKELNLLDMTECSSCDANPETHCVQVARKSDGWPCYECRQKEWLEMCTGDGMYHSCNPNPCRQDEYCAPLQWGEGCYGCYRKDELECSQMDLYDWATCYKYCKEYGEDYQCVPSGITPSGDKCFECVPKDTGKCPPPSFEYGACSQCWENKLWCQQVSTTDQGDVCYQCKEPTKEETCETLGYFSSCSPNPCWEGKQVCVPENPKDSDSECFTCKTKPPTEDDCEYYELYKSCDACDPELEDCVSTPAGEKQIPCYKCVRKPSCEDIGKMTQAGCAQCSEKNQECKPAGVAPNGDECFECVNKKIEHCHDEKMLELTDCFDCEHDTTKECVQVGRQTSDGWPCYECRSKERPEDCEKRQAFSSCSPFPCRDDEECVSDFGKSDFLGPLQCYICQKKEMRICSDNGLADWDTCQKYCPKETAECVSVMDPEIKANCYDCVQKDQGRCQDPAFEYRGCYSCWNAGLQCQPLSTTKDGTVCYSCVHSDENSCAAYGYFQSCTPSPCWEGKQICEPVNPKGTNLQCAECKEKPITEDDCEYYELQSSCDPNPCWDDEECVMTKTGDHQIDCAECKTKGHCEDIGKLNESACEGCKEKGGQCVPSGQAPNGEACYDCVMPKDCAEEGLMNQNACEQECHGDDTRECIKVATAHSGEDCYSCLTKDSYICEQKKLLPGGCPAQCSEDEKCVEKSPEGYRVRCHVCEKLPPVNCPEGSMKGNCPGNCSSDQECVQQDKCYSCATKKKSCEEMGMMPRSACDACEADGKHQCVPKGQATNGDACYECQEKIIEEVDPCSKKQMLPGGCPAQCSGDENCVPQSAEGKACHQCEQKPRVSGQNCQQKGFITLDGCSSCLESGGTCNPAGTDDFGTACYQCQKSAIDDRCENGYAPGKCYEITCSASETCVESTKSGKKVCHKCVPKIQEKSCQNLGAMDGGCPDSCSTGQECIAVNAEGLQCHKCKEAPKTSVCTSSDFFKDSSCDGKCKSDEYCSYVFVSSINGGGTCWRCYQKPTEKVQCTEGTQPGTCPGSCSSDQDCVQNGNCYSCQEKPKTQSQCGYGLSPGGCPGDCIGGAQCFESAGPCHMCRLSMCTPPTFPVSGCPQCYESGGKCIPAGGISHPGGGNNPAGGGGGTAPGPESICVYMIEGAPLCYRCEYPESCEKYGEYSACMECYNDEVCLPGHVLTDSLTGKKFRCVRCVPKKKVKITYVIIIIETPHERFVLDEKSKTGFVPSAFMVLAKVDEATGMVQNAQGELKKIADFVGGFNAGIGAAGIVSTTSLSIDDLAAKLKGKVAGSGKSGSGCFDDFKEGEEDSSGKEKKTDKKSDEPVVTDKDLAQADASGDPAVTGPIVSCGQVGDKKALGIFDASGALVDVVTDNTLKATPTAVEDVLNKAQEASERFLGIKKPDIAQLFSQFTGIPVRQINEMVKNVVPPEEARKGKKKKKEEEVKVEIVPNDPLFQVGPKEKKKKLLGILGSSTEPAPVIMGIGMKMGGAVLGGGSGQKEEGPDIKDQYALHSIGFTPLSDPDSGWNVIDSTQKNVTVAVIDSGFDLSHPDFPANIWKNPAEIPGNGIDDDQNGYVDDVQGWNFLDGNNDVSLDIRGHGTFVAGIIAAKWNNGVGIAGINPGAELMLLKVADGDGKTNSWNIYRAINYAVSKGARVINISLGSRGISKLEQAAIDRANAMGVFVVTASGNNGEEITGHGPASSKHVFAVGETDFDGARSTVSNWGPNNALLAPGEQIYSLCSKDAKEVLPSIRKAGYYKQNGTSFAAPMVAATASLMLAKNPKLTPEEIGDILMATADEMYEDGWDALSGAGFLNAAKALRTDPSKFLIAMFTNLRINLNHQKDLESVDVYGTVRGPFKEFYVEVGKGKLASKFDPVAGPFTQEVTYGFLTRINVKENLRGGDEWVLRIRVIDQNGQTKVATTPLKFGK